jgi:hypothetical protein
VQYNITNKSTFNEARDYLNRILLTREWDKPSFVSEYKWLATREGFRAIYDTDQILRSNHHARAKSHDYIASLWNMQHTHMLPAILVGNKLDLAAERQVPHWCCLDLFVPLEIDLICILLNRYQHMMV